MTITESQRRTLDLMAESAGWNWADVEALSREAYGDCVAGLSVRQANAMIDELAGELGKPYPDRPWAAGDGEHDCDKEYRADCARCNGVNPMDAGCW